jgi:hypothetical protein
VNGNPVLEPNSILSRKARLGKARLGKARLGKARLGKATLGKARLGARSAWKSATHPSASWAKIGKGRVVRRA